MERTFANVTYLGECYPIRLLDVDGEAIEVSVESLLAAITGPDGSIIVPQIDDLITYYVPDLCIYLPDEELVPAIRKVLNGTDNSKMYFSAEKRCGIMHMFSGSRITYYDSLEDLILANNVDDIQFEVIKKNTSNPRNSKLVKQCVEHITELFELNVENSIVMRNGLRITVHFGPCNNISQFDF